MNKRTYGIRTKLSLWYAVIIFLLLNTLYGAIYLTVRAAFNRQSTETVQTTAEHIAHEITYINGRVIVDLGEYMTELALNGLNYAIYSHDNELVAGADFFRLLDFKEEMEKIVHVYYQREHWFIYDHPIHYGNLYIGKVRVILPATGQIRSLNRITYAWYVMLLPGLFISYSVGRLLAESALRPIRDIIRATRLFGYGDLSKRIQTTDYDDEIGTLVTTFNNMADSLEKALLREKQFTSDASHEIRTPIAVIIANAEDAKHDDSLETYRIANEIILERSRELQKILIQLLNLAREYEHAEKMEPEKVDLRQTISNIAQEAKFWAREKNIKIKTQLQKNITIEVDLTMFTRMLVNLLNNAMHYGMEGGLIQLSAASVGDNAVISVCDNGIGIPQEDLPYIFNRFYRVDKSRSDNSTGLGLSFVEMIVKLHKGTISVESTLGEGTCFIITLPHKHT